MRQTLQRCTLLLAAVTLLAVPAEGQRLALSTLEGEVVSIQLRAGEGDLELLAVELRTDAGAGPTKVVLLAPEAACRDIGFAVATGDRLRARVFVPEEGIPTAHKVLNLSQGTMVRFRTLRNVPLWNASGVWQGGPSRHHMGGANAPRHHRGSGGPGKTGGAGPGG